MRGLFRIEIKVLKHKSKLMYSILCVLVCSILNIKRLHAQNVNEYPITFDFNEQNYSEKHGRLRIKQFGTSLTYDRFGNSDAAVYLHGHLLSYLNLGTSYLLKPKVGSISIWFNLDRINYTGIGMQCNPIILTKHKMGDEFFPAYFIAYDINRKCLKTTVSSDTSSENTTYSNLKFQFNTWYHTVITFDNNTLKFYVNGNIQTSIAFKPPMTYLVDDSVMIGNLVDLKNQRCIVGKFDDIQIFHSVLSGTEVLNLYNAPNPKAFKNKLINAAKYLGIIVLFLVIIYLLIYFNKIALKRQKEELELKNKISDLELAVVKAQIKPHFISNCLAAIQELVFIGESDKAKEYMDKFNLFMNQLLISADQNFISLKEELDLIQHYIQFEQLRFKQAFNYELHIDTGLDCNQILIPSLITQPFVENAIWHGLLQVKDNRIAILRINVLIQNAVPIIEICDNGIGRRILVNAKNSSKGISLVRSKMMNLNALIKQDQYSFEIQDLLDDTNQPKGTKVVIYLNSIHHESSNQNHTY